MVDNNGHPAVPANENADVEMRQRLRRGGAVLDDTHDILTRGRRNLIFRGHVDERKVARGLLEYLNTFMSRQPTLPAY